jgi:hypothetical protein
MDRFAKRLRHGFETGNLALDGDDSLFLTSLDDEHHDDNYGIDIDFIPFVEDVAKPTTFTYTKTNGKGALKRGRYEQQLYF